MTEPVESRRCRPVGGDSPRGRIEGRATAWLSVVAMIATRHVNATQICEAVGISRNSFVRHQADLERVYGLVMHYERPDGKFPGWYVIDDWGVLDRDAVIKRYGIARRS